MLLAIRIFIGLFFLASGLVKLFPIEPFELYLYSTFQLDWNFTTVFTRLIIGGEIALGALFCLPFYKDYLLKFTMILLGVFSIFLAYEYTFLNQEECMCFGEHLTIPTHLSIIKNMILISLSYQVWRNGKTFHFKYKELMTIAVIIISFVIPNLFLPDFIYVNNQSNSANGENISLINQNDGVFINQQEGKKLIAFFSMKCKFCKMAAKKLNVFAQRYDGYETGIVFYGKSEDLEPFYEATNSEHFPHMIMRMDSFFQISGPSLPAVFLLDNGKIVQKLGYRELDENDIQSFLDNENN